MIKKTVCRGVAGLVLLGLAGCATPVLDENQVLSNAVVYRLNQDDVLRRSVISVTAAQGVVTLMGTVPNDALRLRAIGIAQGTPGVQKVEDRLQRQ